nr:hypothetical protein [Tanacetum cinerariifolium]
VHAWVKIHKVHVVAYSEDGLSLIASQIGKPVLLDAFTSVMCTEPSERIGYARVLIEVSSEKDLKEEVIIAVPLLNGEGQLMVIDEHVTKKTKAHDGFTTVRNRKNKGRKIATDNARHIDGLKLNKPKPKYVWNVKSNKHNTKKNTVNKDDVNLIKLMNNFSVLQDEDIVISTKSVPKSSNRIDDTNVYATQDSESDVEELENEFNINDDTNKGASTPSDEFLNV